MITFDCSNLIWHTRILPAHYPSPFICTGCAVRSLRHFKKTFLASFIAVSPFFYLPLKLFRAIMLLLKRQNPLPLVILLKPKSMPQLPLVKIVQLKVAQLHSVKVQKVMYWVTWH
ncbi:hypothetical protein HLH14_10475 [Acinetobacter sp. ANC 4282]|uniref:Uncharacterized protein n=1 Tax=Acinetobacter terrae TaxID=2731247 RepID=A0ABX1V848_9GAMM|nr:hypothetical protein [Acinetobacter terrae]NNH16410.1 hypothetical protein [Acinetobacter terrae]NNH88852.1 hypothetical protein [Acinetobacter terrae]